MTHSLLSAKHSLYSFLQSVCVTNLADDLGLLLEDISKYVLLRFSRDRLPCNSRDKHIE